MTKKKKVACSKNILKLIEKEKYIKLDLGAGSNKQEGFVGFDIRPCAGVDIVHDVESFPYPLPNECCSTVLASHLFEHIKPWLMIDLMNEIWRIMKPKGQLLISMPYATSFGFYQDPTHVKAWNEATPQYFDPSQFLFQIYLPKPWRLIKSAYFQQGNMEIIFSKLTLDEGNKILELTKKAGIIYGK